MRYSTGPSHTLAHSNRKRNESDSVKGTKGATPKGGLGGGGGKGGSGHHGASSRAAEPSAPGASSIKFDHQNGARSNGVHRSAGGKGEMGEEGGGKVACLCGTCGREFQSIHAREVHSSPVTSLTLSPIWRGA